jgi:nucleotide-binding universal stress UspA family protein
MAMRKILFPTDFSEPAEYAGRYAALVAGRLGASLHVLHVPLVPPEVVAGTLAPGGGHAARRQAGDRLRQLVAQAEFQGVQTRASVGGVIPEDAIVEAAAESDLIVMGTHGRTGVSRLVLGSVTERVVATAPCPVLAVKHPDVVVELPWGGTLRSGRPIAGAPRLLRLLVPLDGSATSETALDGVAELAQAFNAVVVLVMVLTPALGITMRVEDAPSMPDAAEAATYLARKQRELAAVGVRVQRVIRMGDPATQILACAEEHGADLIALATHGRSGLRRWLLGSVTEKVLRASDVPVLVFRAWAAQRAQDSEVQGEAAAREPGEARTALADRAA